MKPDWDKLIEDFKGDATKLVADVDCTAEGEELCQIHGIEGFPTLKYGDPSMLEDYEGGRDYESLKAFADENLKPMCSPMNIDLCDDEQKAAIKKYTDMGLDTLTELVQAEEEKLHENEMWVQQEVEKLQAKYEEIMKEKDVKDKAIKDAGLGLMKASMISLAEKAGSDEL
mmetsp:Transcript_26121/g.39532  ORF Transcript_26121/g.39532 Transcript_26121/m.39532 type:complete len:171 (-) Transcript_26121:441-953(-)|eukprot:CAMPEP_0178914880 /NCGR_PEP_ID=MMETSP0786-20121207/11686_1 /TAXON_ID=186022 /ORGANISM="Thalassionema frauenfeldii, Strain CCMP 1798" /LENGTH=170 /DNA_ID=CAMNT_0020587867 /DNA_START=184 /DNA_END=696 /DNA_ORIENTATION=-